MDDGCIVSIYTRSIWWDSRSGKQITYRCGKYKIGCSGSEEEKRLCPEWNEKIENPENKK